MSGLDLYKELRLRFFLFVNFKTMDERIELYIAAVIQQGNGLIFLFTLEPPGTNMARD